MTYRLLITGSRRADAAMFDYAYRAVTRAKANGWHIIVGDADGIDFAVIDACRLEDVPHTCYGITAQPRHGEPLQYVRCEGNYLARDRAMADACNRVLAIWNGESRGTKYTYDYARRLGKPGDLITFDRV